MATPAMPQLGNLMQIAMPVQDIERAIAFYRDTLGVRFLFQAGNLAFFDLDGVRLMIGHCPDDKRAAEIGSHSWFGYVEVDDVGALRSEFTARGGNCSPPKDQPYGMREIIVTTPDGHRIVFGQDLNKAANRH